MLINNRVNVSTISKDRCCGCSACEDVCPKRSIVMKEDDEGFLYPSVTEDTCIKCGRCVAVCPIFDYTEPVNEREDACAVQLRDQNEVLKECASGGAYTGLAEYITDKGGVAVGAAFDENNRVVHTIACHRDEFLKHRSSKYVQSDTRGVYHLVREKLEQGKQVLFSGTPCQIVALKKYLGRDFENLYCVDLLCIGVGSPKVLREYLKLMREREHENISYVNFRYKTYGYHSFTMGIRYENGYWYRKSRFTDIQEKCFTHHIADRPCCASCPIKGKNKYSDLTLFDCWHYSELTGQKDNDKGHTTVLVHSEKGNRLLRECRNLLMIEPVDADQAIQLDGCRVWECQKPDEHRDMFWEQMNRNGLEAAVKVCMPLTISDRCKEMLKSFSFRLGILDLVKKMSGGGRK